MLENNEENVGKTESKITEVLNENSDVAVAKPTEKENDTTEAVKEIEKSMAADAENESSKEVVVPVVDYTALSLEELVSELQKTLSSNPIQKIKPQVDGVKNVVHCYQKKKLLL